MSKSIYYQAGEVIFKQGYPSEHAYVILRGQVEVYREMPDGTQEHLATLDEGQMFGEYGVLDEAPRSASVRALTNVELQIMPL